MNPSELYVLVPTWLGLTVVAAGDLVDALNGIDSLDEALDSCGIDLVAATPENIARVQALNETGDADAYWGT